MITDGEAGPAGSTASPAGLQIDEAVGVVVQDGELRPDRGATARGAERSTATSSPPKSFRCGEQVLPRMRTLPASTSARARSTGSARAAARKRSSRSTAASRGTISTSRRDGATSARRPAGTRPA